MRRIVVNGRFLAQPRTGVQRYGVETLRALDALLTRHPALLNGITWQLAVPHDAREIPLIDNFEIQTPQFLTGHLWEQVALAAFARGAYLINASYSAPLFKRSQLVTVHDASVRAQPQNYSLGYRLLNNAMTSVLAPRVHTLMTVSQFSAQELKQRFDLRRDDLVVGHGGWEHASIASGIDEAAVLRRHGLTAGNYLLAVSSPQQSKNFGLIGRALALLGAEPMPPVAVAGAADARIYQSGAELPSAMQWLGFVPDEELIVLYRHAAWFIFPSLYEGFGLPPLEAMANGCPVLASHAASIPEVCGDAALYFDPLDPASLAARLREATQGPDAAARRATLMQRASARLARYTWESNARGLLEHLMRCGIVVPRTHVDLAAPGLGSSTSFA
jgi:glycosyltransferase involved in cell wall biosynthesis